MKNDLTQKETVLRDLQEAGDEGVHGFYWLGKYIPRYGARIYELRQEGYNIRSEHEGHGVRYFLEEDAPAVGVRVDEDTNNLRFV